MSTTRRRITIYLTISIGSLFPLDDIPEATRTIPKHLQSILRGATIRAREITSPFFGAFLSLMMSTHGPYVFGEMYEYTIDDLPAKTGDEMVREALIQATNEALTPYFDDFRNTAIVPYYHKEASSPWYRSNGEELERHPEPIDHGPAECLFENVVDESRGIPMDPSRQAKFLLEVSSFRAGPLAQ